MAQETGPLGLEGLSAELAGVVERTGPSIVRVDDGSRLTATGIIWSEDGLILTTSHGVERDEGVAVELADGARHAAVLVGRDPDTDIAVLRIERSGLPAIESPDEDEVKVGHLVLAVARPGNSGLHATLGIISARFDTERDGRVGYILHTDAVLYPGFSGGALVGMDGRTVGLTNLMFGRGKGVAIGMPVAAQVAQALLAHGRVQRAFLGITTQAVPLPASIAGKLDQPQERGVLIVQVASGSPAEQGGLLLGDLLLRIEETAIQDPEELRQELRAFQPGREVTLGLVRGGELREVKATLGGT
jgi:S1-C subfamily serine protease